MLNPPDKIYLQFYGDQEPPSEPTKVGDVSWCEDSIFEHDILYLRADKVLSLLTRCRNNPANMEMSLYSDIQDFLHYNDE
jgi:hypothetical protein